MKIVMDTTNINSIEDMENFLQANSKIEISVESKKEKYDYINKILLKFRYQKERKKNKTIIKKYFNVYLNYHRVCAFPVDVIDKKGKIKKTYPLDNYETPYEKLKSLEDVKLQENITFDILDKIAYAKSDNEFAEEMKKVKTKLFTNFKN